jgi:hypothetical protein
LSAGTCHASTTFTVELCRKLPCQPSIIGRCCWQGPRITAQA